MFNRDPLDDDVSDVFGGYAPGEKTDDTLARAQQVKASFEEPCRKCRGSGNFVSYTGRILGPCFACKGTGKRTCRTSLEQREKGAQQRAAAAQRLALSRAEQAQAWLDANPVEAAWLNAKRDTFDFARSMHQALLDYGHLTERQLATVQRLAAADAERDRVRAAERAAIIANAPTINVEPIEQAFAKARESRLQNPKLLLDVFRFKPAKATSANAGALYVTHTERQGDDGRELYLGKIIGGKFIRVRACDDATEARILAAAADPEAAAIAYGRRTGQCCICARELTNKVSIERGIGPICAEKFGW